MATSMSRRFALLQFKRIQYIARSYGVLPASASIDEIDHFSKLSDMCWNPDGTQKALHRMNPHRVKFILDEFINYQDTHPSFSLSEKKFLDVGCGGGLLTEALAKTGVMVDGVDANYDVIRVAESHAKLHRSLSNLTYYNTTIEKHGTRNSDKYDAVIISQVLEHINPKRPFLDACIRCVKPGGSIFITTFNKTFMSWLVSVIFLEQVLHVMPRNTHDWEKFISPTQIKTIFKNYKCDIKTVQGMYYEFLTSKWLWTSSDSFCYALHAIKN